MAKDMYYTRWRRLIELRNQLDWTQQQLSDKSGVCKRTLKTMESNEHPVKARMQAWVAEALQVPVEEIRRDAKEDHDGAASDVEWLFVLDGVTHRTEFFLALREDMLGNHDEAIRIASKILSEAAPDDFRTRAFAVLKLSSFTCNLGGPANYARALKLLEDLLLEPDARKRKGANLMLWCQYHRAVALRRLGQFDKARSILEPLLERAPHRLGALHQLGVIDLELALRTSNPALFEAAKQKFVACLDGWGREADTAQHRAGFSLRRLGQLYSATGKLDRAFRMLLDAHAVFAAKGCMRYLKSTETELTYLAQIGLVPA